MTDKKLVLHVNLNDGVFLAPTASRSIDQVINLWLARSALGSIDSNGEWKLSRDQTGPLVTFE